MKKLIKNLQESSYLIPTVVFAALALAWLLYPHPSDTGKGDDRTELTYWHTWAVADELQAAFDEFEKRNPEYKVVIGAAAARDTVEDPTRFLLSVAGGVPPDLIRFDRAPIVEWGSRGAFAPLNEYIEGDKDRPDGIHEENFCRPAWDEPIYRGNIYAIAENFGIRGMYYNRDPLLRAGLVYQADDLDVVAGKAKAGEARPPKTWEELCRKRMHALGTVQPDGTVTLEGFVRRPGVNTELPDDATIDLAESGVRAGDVAVLIAKGKVFRARILKVEDGKALRLDLGRELPATLGAVPERFCVSRCEVKLFDQDSYVPLLSRYNAETGQLTAAGFMPNFGNSWLFLYAWGNGGRFISEDGTRCTMDSPEVVATLEWMTDAYDCIGGIDAANVFQSSELAGGAIDPFVRGKVAIRVDGDWFMPYIMAYEPNLNFGVTSPPRPERIIESGQDTPPTWCSGFAYAIPSTAKNKDGAWKLLRWLASVEANQLIVEYQASLARAKGQSFIPRTHQDRRVMKWYRERFLGPGSGVPPNLVAAFDSFVELMPVATYRPVTPVGQRLFTEHLRAQDKAFAHTATPYGALNYGTRQLQLALDRQLKPVTGPLVPWTTIIVGYAVAVLLFISSLIGYQEIKRRRHGEKRQAWYEGFVCASPWLLGFIVFGAGPIVFSIVISFSNYDVLNPARFVGLQNYINLIGNHVDAVTGDVVANDPLFWKSLRNTAFMIIGVPIGITAGLLIAMLLDTKVRGLHIYRTIFYLPAIVPAVASFILWIWIFSPSTGLLNQMLGWLGVTNPPNWLQDPAWAKPSLILMGLWGVGAGMIIWLAGLKDIPESMYEAAAIDGAGRISSFFHITLPLLSPYIFFNLVMGLIGVFQIFEAAFIMTNGGPADATMFYAYKLFNESFKFLNMGVASAMAWILFVVVLSITLLQLWLGKKWVHYQGE